MVTAEILIKRFGVCFCGKTLWENIVSMCYCPEQRKHQHQVTTYNNKEIDIYFPEFKIFMFLDVNITRIKLQTVDEIIDINGLLDLNNDIEGIKEKIKLILAFA